MARAAVAVVSGGVTLLEACASGTPAVAVAVVPAQRRAIRAVVRARAAVTVGERRRHDADAAARIAELVVRLLDRPLWQRSLSLNGRRLVDGRGAVRVARRLVDVIAHSGKEPDRAVA